MQDELAYALNTLLLYSVNSYEPFVLDHCNSYLLDYMTQYLYDAVKNIPSLNKVFDVKELVPKPNVEKDEYIVPGTSNPPATTQLIKSLSILENYNYPVCDIVLFNQK